MNYRLALLLAGWLPLISHAGPAINVGVVYDYLDGDKSTYLKRVFNSGDATAFVKINILEIVYDADGTAREIPLVNQTEANARDGLMASPARLIVPANGMQGSRLVFMGEREQERYFRVRFVPVVPEKEDEFAVAEEERDEYKKGLSAGVNVLAGYGTVFFVRPRRLGSTASSATKRAAMKCATVATVRWWSTSSETVRPIMNATANRPRNITYCQAGPSSSRNKAAVNTTSC